MMPWKRADLAGVMGRLKLALGVALVVMAAAWYAVGGTAPWAPIGIGLAAWLFVGALIELAERLMLFRTSASDSWARARHLPRSAYGMTIAHMGVAMVLAGVVGSQAWQRELITLMDPGETVTVAGYDFTFQGVRDLPGPNYSAQRGEFVVRRDGHTIAFLFPEKRFYPVQQMPTTEAAIHTTWVSDLYVVIDEQQDRGAWSVRIYHNPLVPWIWIGCIVMAIGGGVSLSDRRLRVGAPRRGKRAGSAGASPQAA